MQTFATRAYDPLEGVPAFHYYLTEITQFGDFETPQLENITHVSKSKQELIDLCRLNNWHCHEAGNGLGGWSTHYIKYQTLLDRVFPVLAKEMP